jgi:hypothetical protein
MSFFTQTIYTSSPQNSFLMSSGNWKFDTSLSLFGIIKSRVISKINRRGSILKLRNNDSFDSIYPMLDEWGYLVVDYYIFKSTWDLEHHIETTIPNNTNIGSLITINQMSIIDDIVQKFNSI